MEKGEGVFHKVMENSKQMFLRARGQLICGTRNYANGKVELWEDDRLNFDDLLNTTNSNSLGRFSIYGQTREIRNIEPYLLITHNCDNGILNTF
uniref:Transthyretin-like family protein n=1 Tax=Parascaris equorum TaxID=6256 RepID=A0A914S5Q9_PAREQ